MMPYICAFALSAAFALATAPGLLAASLRVACLAVGFSLLFATFSLLGVA